MVDKKAPELRFKGFTEEWEQCELKDISDKVIEKNKNNKYSETFTNSAEYGIVNQRDFFDKDISNKNNLSVYYIVKEDDFVYNPRISNFAPVGPIKRNKLGRIGVMSPLYYVFRTYNVELEYLEYYFYGTNWHRFMQLEGDSGARSDRFAIKDSIFKTMPIPYPSLEEQKNIGNFFKQLDKTITLHQRKLDKLKDLKQAYLQQMFPSEGESVPSVRFTNFNRDWEQRKLGESVDFINGRAYKQKELLSEGKYRVLRVGNFNTNDSWYFSDLELDADKYANKGDLLYLWATNFGPVIWNEESVIYHYHIWKLQITDKYLDKEYLYTWLTTDKERIKQTTNGTTMVHVTKGGMEERKFQSPKKIEEQINIGIFFKQLDETISLHQQKLSKLERLKSAYLQKMFI